MYDIHEWEARIQSNTVVIDLSVDDTTDELGEMSLSPAMGDSDEATYPETPPYPSRPPPESPATSPNGPLPSPGGFFHIGSSNHTSSAKKKKPVPGSGRKTIHHPRPVIVTVDQMEIDADDEMYEDDPINGGSGNFHIGINTSAAKKSGTTRRRKSGPSPPQVPPPEPPPMPPSNGGATGKVRTPSSNRRSSRSKRKSGRVKAEKVHPTPEGSGEDQQNGESLFHIGQQKKRTPTRRSKASPRVQQQYQEEENILLHVKRLLESREYVVAKTLLDQGCEDEPGNAELFFARSQVLMTLNNYQGAIADCEKVISLKRDHARAYLRGARLFRMLGCFQIAEKWLNALQVGLDNGQVNVSANDQLRMEALLLRQVQSLMGDIKKRLLIQTNDSSCDRKLSELVKMCPGWPCAYLLMGVYKFITNSEQNRACLELFERAKSCVVSFSCLDGTMANNCQVETAVLMTNIVRKVHREDAIEKAFTVLDFLETTFFESGTHIGPCCKREREQLKALQTAKDTANALFKKELYPQAIFRYKEALKLDPDHDLYNSVILCNRAAAYMAMKQYEAAVLDCEKALEKRPAYVKAMLRKARAKVALNKEVEALVELEQAYARNPAHELLQEISSMKDKIRRAQQEEQDKAKASSRWSKFERKRRHSSYTSSKKENIPRQHHHRTHSDGIPKEFFEQQQQQTKQEGETENNNKHKDSGRLEAAKSHYELLGIDEKATKEQIKKAYHKLALKYHPDKAGAHDARSTELFKRIGQAYDILKDPYKRTEYDRTLQASRYTAYRYTYGGGVGRSSSSSMFTRTNSYTNRSRSHYYYC